MSDFVDFNLAKKLKEKGFSEKCLGYYAKDSEFYYNICYGSDVESAFASFNSQPHLLYGKRIDSPTISQVLKWLREEKQLLVSPSLFRDGYESYVQSTIFEDDKDYTDAWRVKGFHPTYEEAAIVGIEYVLDNLI